MRVKAQVAMVMNLDKCIGCHTCSVTCKNVWTNRPGAEYIWFNDVETKPGTGYPREWENQKKWAGGWKLDRKGRLKLRAGGRLFKLLTIFWNPHLPLLDDFYDPWSYDYQTLSEAPHSKHQPVAQPHSTITGQPTSLCWGPNWEDDLAGDPKQLRKDPNLDGLQEKALLEYQQAFMMYLPRICEHCLNPSCVASCPSGAMYKREEDGIVLVDQDKCRGWRFCVSGCPYKKVYFNHQTGKAEKCTFCYPRIENGEPTICSETCVGRLRYLGVVLYDADRVTEAASVPDEKDLLEAQLSLFLDSRSPEVQAQARADGVPDSWIEAAKRSPIYALAIKYRVALPLHPEFRTLPMVWYVPPLSPVLDSIAGVGDVVDVDDIFPTIDSMRIPLRYLANLLSAGDEDVIRGVLRKLTVMRALMRSKQVPGSPTPDTERLAGMSESDVEDLYRLLAIARYEDRYVIPPGHREHSAGVARHGAGTSLSGQGGPQGWLETASEPDMSRPVVPSGPVIPLRQVGTEDRR